MAPSRHDDDNEFDEISGVHSGFPTDKLTMILLHVGETRKGIKRLESDVSDVKDSVSALQNNTVRRPECTERHVVVANSIKDLSSNLTEIRDNVRAIKRGTGQTYPVVTGSHSMPSVLTAPTKSIEEVLDAKQEKARKSITFWLYTISALSTLIGGAVFGLVKLGTYTDRVNKVMERSIEQSEQTRRTTDELVQEKRKMAEIQARIRDAGLDPNDPASGQKRVKR